MDLHTKPRENLTLRQVAGTTETRKYNWEILNEDSTVDILCLHFSRYLLIAANIPVGMPRLSHLSILNAAPSFDYIYYNFTKNDQICIDQWEMSCLYDLFKMPC